MISAARFIDTGGIQTPDRTLWFLTLVWCGAILAAPVLRIETIYSLFSLVCHQIPDRSWPLAGHALPVCIRCISIYFGFMAALTLRLRSSSGFLRLAIAGMAVEFLTARAGADSETARALSGVVFGLATAEFVRSGVREMWNLLERRPGLSGEGAQ